MGVTQHQQKAPVCASAFGAHTQGLFSLFGIFTSDRLRENPQSKDLFTNRSNTGLQMERGQSSCLFIFLLHLTCLFTNSSLNHRSPIFVVLVATFLLLFRLPTVAFLHAGALQHQTAPWEQSKHTSAAFKRVYRCFKEYIFFFFPFLLLHLPKATLTFRSPSCKETHVLHAPGRSVTSSVSLEGYATTGVPFLSGDEI